MNIMDVRVLAALLLAGWASACRSTAPTSQQGSELRSGTCDGLDYYECVVSHSDCSDVIGLWGECDKLPGGAFGNGGPGRYGHDVTSCKSALSAKDAQLSCQAASHQTGATPTLPPPASGCDGLDFYECVMASAGCNEVASLGPACDAMPGGAWGQPGPGKYGDAYRSCHAAVAARSAALGCSG